MNGKIELLKDLIEISTLDPQPKINKIIQTLQRTEDIMKAKLLSQRILAGDFSILKEQSINDLIEAFESKEKHRKDNLNPSNNEEFPTNNKEQSLEYEVKRLRLQLEATDYKNKQLVELNKKYESALLATKMFELIEVPDKDINELYVVNLKDKAITTYNEAFILNNVIPKTYYRIKK